MIDKMLFNVLSIEKKYVIIALDGPVRGHHVGRFIIRNIALDLFARPLYLPR